MHGSVFFKCSITSLYYCLYNQKTTITTIELRFSSFGLLALRDYFLVNIDCFLALFLKKSLSYKHQQNLKKQTHKFLYISMPRKLDSFFLIPIQWLIVWSVPSTMDNAFSISIHLESLFSRTNVSQCLWKSAPEIFIVYNQVEKIMESCWNVYANISEGICCNLIWHTVPHKSMGSTCIQVQSIPCFLALGMNSLEIKDFWFESPHSAHSLLIHPHPPRLRWEKRIVIYKEGPLELRIST